MSMHDRRGLGIVSPALIVSVIALSTASGEQPVDRYAQALRSDQGLVGYWRMEGDLTDARSDASAAMHGGEPGFVAGPVGGKALTLGKGQFVTVAKTPQLDVPATTVTLFFKLTAKLTSNACLIAKRHDADNRITRYSLHLSRDARALLIWNGRAVLRADFPLEPLKVGQWYHLAVSATDKQVDVYLDGVALRRITGDGFTVSASGLPLRIGAASAAGYEQCLCEIDEIAFFARCLDEKTIDRYLTAAGWAARKQQVLQRRAEQKRRERARWEARMRMQAEILDRRMNAPALLARGDTHVYRGDHLAAVSLPLGGIGAGCLQIDGAGRLSTWQIFNNFNAASVPHSFFAVRATRGDAEPVVRALQTDAVGPFRGVKALSFRGEYPFGWYDFEDADLPVAVRLEVFCPLIPLRARDSAIPCAIFNLTARNATDRPVDVTFLASQQNAVGFTGKGKIQGRRHGDYGGNKNQVLRQGDATVLHLSSDKPKDAPGAGDMALAAPARTVRATACWKDLDALLADLSKGGELDGGSRAGPSPDGETLDGALAVPLRLEPGKSGTVAFVLAWHFPNAKHGRGEWSGEGNMYANWWDGALAVAGEVRERLDELTRQTRLYHDTLYATNLPYWLLDRISSQVAVLRSKTCFWTAGDYVGGWEGCCPGEGCCYGNCAHVWHYAQAHARLFPSVARRMRQQALRYQQADGGIPFRLPKHGQACDGQCGEVLEAYREHLIGTGAAWLDQHWPRIKKAMDYVIKRWDADEDGVLSGAQHNTLDCELGGSSSWLGSLYLAALRASERMARLVGYRAAAERYRRICESGAAKQNDTLFNGEYYIQIPEATPQRDYNNGCHIDQVLGQWWAHQLDLGWLYPPDRVRSAMRALLKYNFQDTFHGIVQKPRRFVADDDAGMQMIVWPQGDRPDNHMLYADEVMTGFEYAAAAMMVQAGMVKEGFTVVHAIADRYDGRRRTGLPNACSGYTGNPFGDDECGKFYARAMSVWSMLLACQGFSYDGPAGAVGFRPVWRPEDHASFFSTAEGWGLFRQKRSDGSQYDSLEVRYGRLRVGRLVFAVPVDLEPTQVRVTLADEALQARHELKDGTLTVQLDEGVTVETGQTLTVEIKP